MTTDEIYRYAKLLHDESDDARKDQMPSSDEHLIRKEMTRIRRALCLLVMSTTTAHTP